jgi:hypothetical protein
MTYAGAAKTITLPAGKIGLVVFDATAGQNLVLELTNITIANSNVTISKPDASTLYTVNLGPPSGRAEMSNLPVTGTYTVVVEPGANAGNMTLKVGGPDLTVTTLTVPTTPVSRTGYGTWSFDITWTVKNNGNIKALTPWDDLVYLSVDNLWDVNDLVLAGVTYNPCCWLDPGASYTTTRTVTVPSTQAPGAYYILVKTDANNTVLETSETNNVKAAAITLLP